MTNCDIICTFVMIKLASWCKRSAACTVRSRPKCSSQYSGVWPSNRADSGAPCTPSYGGRVGGCHTMGQGRRDSSGHHMTSSDTGSQPYCPTPLAIVRFLNRVTSIKRSFSGKVRSSVVRRHTLCHGGGSLRNRRNLRPDRGQRHSRWGDICYRRGDG